MIVEHQPGRTLADRPALAALLQRSAETIRRRCTPVACATATRAVLYDVDTAEAELRQHPARAPRRR